MSPCSFISCLRPLEFLSLNNVMFTPCFYLDRRPLFLVHLRLYTPLTIVDHARLHCASCNLNTWSNVIVFSHRCLKILPMSDDAIRIIMYWNLECRFDQWTALQSLLVFIDILLLIFVILLSIFVV